MDTIVPAAPQPAPQTTLAAPPTNTLPPPVTTSPETPVEGLSHHIGNLAQARPFGTVAVAVLVGMGLASLITLVASQNRHGRWHG